MIKILTHFAHSSYQQSLAEIPDVEFYHVVDPTGIWPQNKEPKCVWPADAPKPANIRGINAADVNPSEFDLLLIHWHPFIETFGELWGKHLPTIFCEHTWPFQNMAGEVNHWKNVRHEYIDHTVYITESSKEAWAEKNNRQTASVIYHAIDIDKFPQKDYTADSINTIMTTTNEFISRDWACGFTVWANVLGITGKPYFPKDLIQLFGYGNDAIKPYARGVRDRDTILKLLTQAAVYFNPSQMSPIPMSLLEAIAVGTPIVSTAKCEIGKLFKNNEDGIISNEPAALREGIKYLLMNPDRAEEMAKNAQNKIKTHFSPQLFNENWLRVFSKANKSKG